MLQTIFWIVVLVAVPLYLRFVKNIKNFDLSASRKVAVSCRQSTAQRYIRDVSNLEDYEMKVLKSSVVQTYGGKDHEPNHGKASTQEADLDYALQGYAMGIWWQAVFSMRFLSCGGFWSQCKGGPISRLLPKGSPSGGFMLRKIDDTKTMVIHTEKYLLPYGTPFGWIIAPLWRGWLGRSMEVEMEIIKESLELIEASEDLRDSASRLPEHHPAVVRFRSKRYGLPDYIRETLLGSPKLHIAKCSVYP